MKIANAMSDILPKYLCGSAMFVFLPSVGKKVKFETDVFSRSGPSDGSVLKRYRPTVQQRKR